MSLDIVRRIFAECHRRGYFHRRRENGGCFGYAAGSGRTANREENSVEPNQEIEVTRKDLDLQPANDLEQFIMRAAI